MSDSLQHHGLQHARLPCPSPTPRVYSNSCSSGQWSNHLILCRPFLLPPLIFPSIRVFSSESVLPITWPKSGGLVFPSLEEFSTVYCDPHKGFGIVNKAEIEIFLELSCFFDPVDVGNLISGSSGFSKTSLNIWKFTVHVLLKPGLENFDHDFASMWDECNCAVVWAFFGIAFLLYWKENWPLPVLGLLLSFPNLLTYWVQHFHSI